MFVRKRFRRVIITPVNGTMWLVVFEWKIRVPWGRCRKFVSRRSKIRSLWAKHDAQVVVEVGVTLFWRRRTVTTSCVDVWIGGGTGRGMKTYVNIVWLLWWSVVTDHCESICSILRLR